MLKVRYLLSCFYFFLCLTIVSLVSGDVRSATEFIEPDFCTAVHSIGKITISPTNGANTGGWYFGKDKTIECLLGDHTVLGEYPKGSGIKYFDDMAVWVGGILGGDTLVSTGWDVVWAGRYEFFPDMAPFGEMEYRSTLDPTSEAYAGAFAEEEYVAACTDTFTGSVPGLYPDQMSNRAHKPLHVRIDQRSMSWSPGYADDFVLFEFRIANIGPTFLEGVYVGFLLDGQVSNVFCESEDLCEPWRNDDICGMLRIWVDPTNCNFADTLNLAWAADGDGDPLNGSWVYRGLHHSSRNVTGIRLLSSPDELQSLTFNWWTFSFTSPLFDFGPRARPTPGHPYRDFNTGGGTGTPVGDLNMYNVLSNHEWDYDQVHISKISMTDPKWMYPHPSVSTRVAQGGSPLMLLSVGPFDLHPGESMSFPLAYVGSENFHIEPNNFQHLLNDRPDDYLSNLNFSQLATNARWAEWVYDNPGVDTDSDGYAGAYRVCVLDSQFIDDHWVIMAADTTWYKGDGVPDWRAVQPPPAPTFWLEPTLNGIRVRFNGQRSETTKDIFSGIIDFEGYRIYMGRDERESSLSLAASYDKENYDIYVWNPKLYPSGDFEIQHRPSTLTELRCRFGAGMNPCDDSTFAPLAYTRTSPWRSKFFADSVFYFMPHENNVSNLGVATPIRKVYPEALPPGPTDTVTADDLSPEGYLKCYEYECFIENLLPTVSYYVNVTAFDFGSPEADLEALETSKLLGIQSAYPFADINQSDSTLPPVYIYPNPYRYDAHYRDMGYEGRASNRIDDRERRVHFVNVPAKCTIRIHTLDGDLVRELRHDEDPSDPNSHHATWDLINRNVQAIVSGLYYWTVESPDGSVQMGKLVVIQ